MHGGRPDEPWFRSAAAIRRPAAQNRALCSSSIRGFTAPDALTLYALEKAASLNQHVIGYGELAEREWAALGLDAPDMAKARRTASPACAMS
jgi:hypothetical protein